VKMRNESNLIMTGRSGRIFIVLKKFEFRNKRDSLLSI
jgi:hypothetical protein